MQAQFDTAEMEVVIEVVDAIDVEEACTSDPAVNFVSFREQELGKIGAVLPCNTGDQCTFCHVSPSYRISIVPSFRKVRAPPRNTTAAPCPATLRARRSSGSVVEARV